MNEHSSPGGPADDDLMKEVEAAMSQMSPEDLAELSGSTPPPAQGSDASSSRRRGKILAIYDEDVFIDLGGKSQAVVSRSQFRPDDVLEVGHEVEVVVERYDPDSGCLIASRDGAIQEARWENISVGSVVEGRITGMNKGGLEVDIKGIRGFMPASQVDLFHVKDISTFIGQVVHCEVMEIQRRSRNLLLSRRRVIEKERAERKEKIWEELEPGQLRTGVVGNLTDFGAFVDLGGVDGLIHISDLSYRQVEKVSDVVHSGMQVEVKVLKVDRERSRISLGLKQARPDPWSEAETRYSAGTSVNVRVLRLEKFGAFVEVEEGIEGLIPLSEMSWSRVNKASDVLETGQMTQAVVIRVEGPPRRRMALSLKQVEPDPWDGAEERFPAGGMINGRVTKCAEFGAFVELAAGVEGLVHISELSDQRVRRCEDVVQPGQEVEVRVLGVDLDHRRISLSMKATAEGSMADLQAQQAQATPRKKRKKPLRGGLTSHFEWQGQSFGNQ